MDKLVILTYTPCAGGIALKVGWTLTQVAALLVDARPILTVVWVLTLVDVCTTDTAALIKGLHDERHVRLYETGSFTNTIITVNVSTTNRTSLFMNIHHCQCLHNQYNWLIHKYSHHCQCLHIQNNWLIHKYSHHCQYLHNQYNWLVH